MSKLKFIKQHLWYLKFKPKDSLVISKYARTVQETFGHAYTVAEVFCEENPEYTIMAY